MNYWLVYYFIHNWNWIEEKINLLYSLKNKILGLINKINTKKSYSYLIDSIIDINKANLSYEIYYQKTEILTN